MAGGIMQLVANSSLTGVTLTATSGNPSVPVGTQTIPVSSLSVGANSVQITPGSSILTALQSGATINYSLSCSYADGKSVVSTAGTPYPPPPPPLLSYATFSTSFVNINKYNSDPPFALETPVSNNNTAFSFTSSNTAVASINPPTIINALKFNGTTNFVDFGANIVELGKSSFTIECWVKTSGTSMGLLICQNSNSTWEIGEKSLYIDANGIPVFVGFQCNFIYATVAVNDNLWHHIAVTWLYTGGTSGTPTFYVDGINRTGTTHPFYSQFPQYTANTFNVGTFVFGKPNNQESVNFFNGSVCELRIWSIARSANEIFQNYRRMLAGNETGLVAYNRFNQGIAGVTNTDITNVINNKTTGGYTGTLSGSFVLTGTSSNFISGISIRESTDVNINGVVGTTTITATQEASSIYASTSVSATLMVISPLVSLYPFNSNGNDASTNNNNLTNVNNVTFNTSGRNQGDGAASFSGNNYFEIANDGRFSPDNFSIAFWIKPGSNTKEFQSIATCRNNDYYGTSGWMIYISPSNNLEFWTGANNTWSGYDQDLFSNFGSLNTWVHVAFTFTKASGLLVVYINGTLGTNVLRSYVNNNGTSLRIGAGGDAVTYFLRSGTLLDDFRIYNKVLTATEVSRVFEGYL